MESSLFALLIKGGVLRRSAALHLAGNNDLFLPHHWASSISLANKECSHGWAERGRLAAPSLATFIRARGVLTNGPAEGEASRSRLQPHRQTAASGASPELAHVIDKLPRKRLDPRWKTAHLSTDSTCPPQAGPLSFLGRQNSNRALFSLQLRDGQSLCPCAYLSLVCSVSENSRTAERGNRSNGSDWKCRKFVWNTKGDCCSIRRNGLSRATGAQGRVRWTRMEKA